MAREPQDIFVKEFFQHPAWETVFESLNNLRKDVVERLTICPLDALQEQRLRLDGITETISHLEMLIKTKR